jgi:DNA-binding FadR family transcriptional regulator
VALEIVRDIVAQRLQVGDGLIDEAKMLARYRASRSSLREALRLLEVQGLISIRAGRGTGTTVGKPHASNLARTLTLYLHMMGATYDQLLEAWTRTEPLLAQLAAENKDRSRVKERLAPFVMRSGRKDEHQWTVPEGLDFHEIIAELADNPVLSLSLSAIAFVHSQHLLSVTHRKELEEPLVHDHSHIAKAIIAGDSKKARELMEEHTRHIVEEFKAYWPRQVGERIEWR